MSEPASTSPPRPPRTYAIAILPFALVTLWAIIAVVRERAVQRARAADAGATDASTDANGDVNTVARDER